MTELQLDIRLVDECTLGYQDILQGVVVVRIVCYQCFATACRTDGGESGLGCRVDGDVFSFCVLPNSIVVREDLIVDSGTARCIEKGRSAIGNGCAGDGVP